MPSCQNTSNIWHALPIPSCASDIAVHSSFPLMGIAKGNTGHDHEIVNVLSKRKALFYEGTEILDTTILEPAKHNPKEGNLKTPAKKPRLEWVLQETFGSHQESEALAALSSSAPSGYRISKNQPNTNRLANWFNLKVQQ